jgi:hypothetical protein
MGPAPRARRLLGKHGVLGWASFLVLGSFVSGDAQTPVRRATNIAAILAYPNFYHMRSILVVGTVAQQPNGDIRVSDSVGSLRVIPEGSAPDGLNEVRGQFWDIGRMKSDDPRFAGMDLAATFRIDPDGAWPRPGEVTAIMAANIAPAAPAPAAIESSSNPGFPLVSLRSLVLDASRYLDQKVTLTGQYYGRNLSGDLPESPGQSRFDFVLRVADASIWVTNLRPRGKDSKGREFDLGLDARLDTGKWLRVSGTVRQGRGLLWIEGEANTLAMTEAPTQPGAEAATEEPSIRVPAAPAAEVVFSAPTEDEIDVSLATNVRIQFSRDVDPATFKGRIRVGYAGSPDGSLIAETFPADKFKTAYRAANRVLELNFTEPLTQFRTVKVELLEGILGTDKQEVKPWTLTFLLGGP